MSVVRVVVTVVPLKTNWVDPFELLVPIGTSLAPWVGYDDEDELRERIIALSKVRQGPSPIWV